MMPRGKKLKPPRLPSFGELWGVIAPESADNLAKQVPQVGRRGRVAQKQAIDRPYEDSVVGVATPRRGEFAEMIWHLVACPKLVEEAIEFLDDQAEALALHVRKRPAGIRGEADAEDAADLGIARSFDDAFSDAMCGLDTLRK